jgi:hypothetical protein
MRALRLFCSVVLLMSLGAGGVFAAGRRPVVGETEKTYALPKENDQPTGVAVEGDDIHRAFVYVLDRSGKLCAYRPGGSGSRKVTELKLLDSRQLPKDADGGRLRGVHGLAVERRGTRQIFYFLNWEKGKKRKVKSQLWWWNPRDGKAEHIDLTDEQYQLGARRTFGVAVDGDDLLVSYHAAKVKGRNTRVGRGIVRLRWDRKPGKSQATFVRHMPDAGMVPSHGLSRMTLDGADYLWATVGNRHIYCAEASTGRGLFFFERPRAVNGKGVGLRGTICEGVAFGGDSLWVLERNRGPDFLHRVNVTKNLDAPHMGPRIVRRLTMTIRTRPERRVREGGKVYHFYSRPYDYEQMPRQGVWPETEVLVDLSEVRNAMLRPFTYDPAGDRSSRQYMASIVYGDARARPYKSQYKINYWTSDFRKYVYPHRVDKKTGPLRSTDYLADDPLLFNLKDRETYTKFVERVKTYIGKKYGVPADMKNAYWAARNAVEYIQDHYYYPVPDKGFLATTDWKNGHFDANPGNLKLALSEKPYDKTQIIACSGTSVAITGTMRHLRIPARWLGTGMEKGPKEWDDNNNGLLDPGESAPLSNGHRYTQVWLGSHYGWICFDGTPVSPAKANFDPPPPVKSQWQYMLRAAGGHRVPKRIVFNVGSGLFEPLYMDFELKKGVAINNCGGNQRYNLMGRFDHPERWRRPGLRMSTQNVCFVTDVKRSGPWRRTRITWRLQGKWDKTPESKLSVFLASVEPEKKKEKDKKADEEEGEGPNEVEETDEEPVMTCKILGELAHGISLRRKSVVVDLSKYHGKNLCLLIRKVGDPETGGQSELFDLERR